MNRHIWLVLNLIFLISTKLYSQTINKIYIEGLKRTKESVILREIIFQEGEQLTDEQINESLIRLKNTQIFSSVDIKLHELEDDYVDIYIYIIEKWTTIPIMKAGGGGGINYLTIGTFDTNLMGNFIELGGQYERLGNTNSGVFWFRNPRFLDKRITLGSELWFLTRNKQLYDSNADGSGGYTNLRNRVHIFADNTLTNKIKLGLGIDYTDDSYSEDAIGDSTYKENLKLGLRLPEGSKYLQLYHDGGLGRLKYENHLVHGGILNYKLSYGIPLSNNDPFYKYYLSPMFFYKLPGRWGNPGIKLTFAESSSNLPQFQNYIGGLDAVRGYYHEQFLTKSYWQLNAEYRIESIKTKWFVLQHVIFVDVGNTGKTVSEAIFSDEKTFIGYGTGLRFISPQIYRLNVRLDYGWTEGRQGPGGFSFGLQHFF